MRELYGRPPDEFTARRTELAGAARAAGDTHAAAEITRLRKPTVGAWLVNAVVLDDPSVVERLSELGERLRAAQSALDAAALRALSEERRRLVDTFTADAFGKAGRRDPPAGLRDEVSGTFEAAIADEDVAARLGRLQRAEQWSGFGFLPTDGPHLSVVAGGRAQDAEPPGDAEPSKDRKSAKAAKAANKQAPPKPSPAERRRQQRALAAARDAFEAAERASAQAHADEQQLNQEVRRLGTRLAKLQRDLGNARARLEKARKAATAARAARREARSALDRAERDAGR